VTGGGPAGPVPRDAGVPAVVAAYAGLFLGGAAAGAFLADRLAPSCSSRSARARDS